MAVSIARRCDEEAVEDAGGSALRPGGLALTARALDLAACRELTGRREAHRFRVEAWEDHSRALAAYTAHAILAGASLGAARGGRAGCAEAPPSADSVRSARPSYFLLVAANERRASGIPPRRGEEGGDP